MIQIAVSFITSIIPFWLYWNYHFYTQKRFIPEKKEGILWLDILILPMIPIFFFIIFEKYIIYIGMYLLGYLFFYIITFMEWKRTFPFLKRHKPLVDFVVWAMSMCLCIVKISSSDLTKAFFDGLLVN